jgi:hypothetical protein
MGMNEDELVWYASYGSNCSATRFRAYLTGTRADGAQRSERGARDSTPPSASEPHWFPHPVRFLGDSSKWGGGGVAFLDHTPSSASPGRRYLITKGQFDDVAAQESRRELRPLEIDKLKTGVVSNLGDGFYDGLLLLPAIDGVPVLTFTSPIPLDDRPTNAPSPAYLGTIVRGLAEVHEAEAATIAEWTLRSPGVAAGWTTEEIVKLLK